MNARADRFPLFDSLRAVAALSVVAFHAAFFSGAFTSDSPLRPYLAHLDVGVSVFFLISGFLLYRPFVRARLEDRPLPHVGAYAWRRFLRIAPAYWVALTVVSLWLGFSMVFTAGGIPVYYGFAQIYSSSHGLGGIAQAWTLCVEVTFYAFLPLWAAGVRFVLGRIGGRLAGVQGELVLLAGLWLLSLLWKLYALRHVDSSALDAGPWLMPLPNFLDQFALGMGLAVLSLRPPAFMSAIARRPWIPLLLAAAAYFAVCALIGLTGRLGQNAGDRTFLVRHELYSLVALGLIVPAIFGWERRDAVRRVLAWRPLLYVGLVSYGVYLWHYAIVLKTAHAINHWLVETVGLGLALRFVVYFVAGAVLSTAVASLSYFLLERPVLRLKRLVGPARMEVERGEAIAEPAPATPPTAR
jgi:peptidoglycan/LPS O-acetylase OafA/YrhL